MRKPLVAFVVFVAVLFAGVAVVQGQGASTPPAGGETPCASPVASPAAGMTPTMAASPSAMASPEACGGNTVKLEDIKFDPKELTIAANTDVTITVTNQGATTHNFNIDELNIHSGDVQPGASTTVKVNAKAGDYQYYCNIPGHKAAGMVGTLHVK